MKIQNEHMDHQSFQNQPFFYSHVIIIFIIYKILNIYIKKTFLKKKLIIEIL